MSHDVPRRPDGVPPSNRPLLWAAGVLLLLPMIAIAAVPTYARTGPRLGAFPFFVWYQLLWVFLTAACTLSAHALIKRARGTGAPADPVEVTRREHGDDEQEPRP